MVSRASPSTSSILSATPASSNEARAWAARSGSYSSVVMRPERSCSAMCRVE